MFSDRLENGEIVVRQHTLDDMSVRVGRAALTDAIHLSAAVPNSEYTFIVCVAAPSAVMRAIEACPAPAVRIHSLCSWLTSMMAKACATDTRYCRRTRCTKDRDDRAEGTAESHHELLEAGLRAILSFTVWESSRNFCVSPNASAVRSAHTP